MTSCEILIPDFDVHLEQFRKPAASDCVVNFKKSISPKNYKWSNFIGEIHRANNTTSTVAARDIAIENTKQILKLQYDVLSTAQSVENKYAAAGSKFKETTNCAQLVSVIRLARSYC